MNLNNEIRRLLDLYYKGETSKEEEKFLYDFFRTANKLPEDLEADRRLFSAFGEEPWHEIPLEEDKKILEAINNEISRDKNPKLWKRPIFYISTAAACLLIVFLAINMAVPQNNKEGDEPMAELSDKANKIEIPQIDTINDNKNFACNETKKEKLNRISNPQQLTNGKNLKTETQRPEKSAALNDTQQRETPYYLTQEEEEQLIARNYRVVNDEREAFAIMNSVFSRMDGNLQESSYRIDDISDKYERVSVKL